MPRPRCDYSPRRTSNASMFTEDRRTETKNPVTSVPVPRGRRTARAAPLADAASPLSRWRHAGTDADRQDAYRQLLRAAAECGVCASRLKERATRPTYPCVRCVRSFSYVAGVFLQFDVADPRQPTSTQSDRPET